jgi:hypothetical protein
MRSPFFSSGPVAKRWRAAYTISEAEMLWPAKLTENAIENFLYHVVALA